MSTTTDTPSRALAGLRNDAVSIFGSSALASGRASSPYGTGSLVGGHDYGRGRGHERGSATHATGLAGWFASLGVVGKACTVLAGATVVLVGLHHTGRIDVSTWTVLGPPLMATGLFPAAHPAGSGQTPPPPSAAERETLSQIIRAADTGLGLRDHASALQRVRDYASDRVASGAQGSPALTGTQYAPPPPQFHPPATAPLRPQRAGAPPQGSPTPPQQQLAIRVVSDPRLAKDPDALAYPE